MDIGQLRQYRRALGAFATGVAVVAADCDEGVIGLTISSFTSVSLDPPLILWCLDDRPVRRRALAAAPRFTVNVLGAEDRAHAERFSNGACWLEPHELQRAPGGPPRLSGALACFDCEARERIRLGDHLAIVGAVTAFDSREGDGLLHFRGQFGQVEDGLAASLAARRRQPAWGETAQIRNAE